jgi:hypothetical protein
MKARLMHPERDFDPHAAPPRQAGDLIRDLGLDTLVAAMAEQDEFLAKVATAALVTSVEDPAVITYRQRILADCLRVPALAREIYDLAGEALVSRRKIWAPFSSDSPTTAVHSSVEVLQLYVGFLHRLRELAERYRPQVRSEGLTAVFDELVAELSDQYFAEVDEHLDILKFRQGILMTARLDAGCRGTDYVLRRIRDDRNWFARLFSLPDPNSLSFTIPERDDAGWQALGSLRDEGMVLVARAVGEAAEHVQSFFTMLRRETGFYVGCLNLHDQLRAREASVCFPEPLAPGTATLVCRGLYEPGLRLRTDGAVVGNDVTGEHVPLIMVTGANQGGKSTFLRSLGIAQLMMQSGMFVPADSFTATAYRGVFTHYRREEDASMESGKLDEELARMSDLTDRLRPGALLLSNESFASTNEREGSQIARHVFRGLVSAGVTVVAVTHLYDLASTLYQGEASALFLRAERREDGSRTFRVAEGRPLTTSFGKDLYVQIFGEDAAPQGHPARTG